MLFYSYAELVVGLIAVFYFTSKIFVITKYKLYFILSLLVVIITASISMFIDEGQKKRSFTVYALCGIDIYTCNIRIQ